MNYGLTHYLADVWSEMQRDAAPTVEFTKHEAIQKTKKAHVCGICKKEIPVGSAASRTTMKIDSDFGSVYECSECG